MKILAAADFMVLAGDLLGCPDGYDAAEDAQRADAAVIVSILRGTAVPVYFIGVNVEEEPPGAP